MTKSAKPVSEIDRLIELASDDKPRASLISGEAGKPNRSLSLEDQKEPRPSMWRVLIQLRVLLPYLAKLLPLLERGLLGTNITGHATPAIDTSNLDRGIAGVGEAQRDLNTVVKAQTAEIHLLRERIAELTEAVEKSQLSHQEIATGLTSLRKLVTISVWVIIALLMLVMGAAWYAVLGPLAHAG